MDEIFQSRGNRKWFRLWANDIYGPFESQAQAEKFLPTAKKAGYKPYTARGFHDHPVPLYRRPGQGGVR